MTAGEDDRPPLHKARRPKPWDPANPLEPAMSTWLSMSEHAFGAWRAALGVAAPPSPSTPPWKQEKPVSPSAATGKTVVLINTFVVPPAFEDAFLQWWRLARMGFASQPGFVSAKLHRSLDEKERYRFINIAQWESSEAYQRGLSQIWTMVPKPRIPGLEWHPTLYEVVEEA